MRFVTWENFEGAKVSISSSLDRRDNRHPYKISFPITLVEQKRGKKPKLIELEEGWVKKTPGYYTLACHVCLDIEKCSPNVSYV